MSFENNCTSNNFIKTHAADIESRITIDKSYYEKHAVKRGLRNPDGTGVMAGVTRIGSIQGYYMRDGERVEMPGKLYYRGLDVEDIVKGFLSEKRSGFEETAYLLLFGKLPNQATLKGFTDLLEEYRELPEGFTENMILSAPSVDIMNKLARSILAMFSYDDDPETDGVNYEKELSKALHLLAQSPVIVANAFAAKRHYYDKEGLHLHRTEPGLSIAENFLHSVRHDNSFTEDESRLLDLCMVLHAEHGGGNNSAFSCRVLSSSGTDIYSAISAAVGSLKGPRHGGANAKVMEMLSLIEKDVSNWSDDEEIASYLAKIVRKEVGKKDGLIYGMGHAVYTLSDPRAVILRDLAKSLADKKDMLKEFFLIEAVERLAPEVFQRETGAEKKLCANVDMYSGFVYKMLGIPQELYTPLFAISRMAGWCAHRIEEVFNGGRIIRPAYKAISIDKKYTPIAER